jgi:hypothetical protein
VNLIFQKSAFTVYRKELRVLAQKPLRRAQMQGPGGPARVPLARLTREYTDGGAGI